MARWSGSWDRAMSGKTTLCLVASGLAPRMVGGTLSGVMLLDGDDTDPTADARAHRESGYRLRQPGHPAHRGRRHRVRGGRLRPHEPWASAGRGSEPNGECSPPVAHRRIDRSRPRAAVWWSAAACGDCRVARAAPRSPRPRRADRAARSCRNAARRRRAQGPCPSRCDDHPRRAESGSDGDPL